MYSKFSFWPDDLSFIGVAVAASVFTIMAMSIDRYLAIRSPMAFRRVFNRKSTVLVIVALWLVALSIFAPVLRGVSEILISNRHWASVLIIRYVSTFVIKKRVIHKFTHMLCAYSEIFHLKQIVQIKFIYIFEFLSVFEYFYFEITWNFVFVICRNATNIYKPENFFLRSCKWIYKRIYQKNRVAIVNADLLARRI